MDDVLGDEANQFTYGGQHSDMSEEEHVLTVLVRVYAFRKDCEVFIQQGVMRIYEVVLRSIE